MKKNGMDGSYTLRKATRTDEERVGELYLEMLRSIYHRDDVKGYEEGDLDKFFCDREDLIELAEAEGRVVAFLSIEAYRGTEAGDYIYLDDLSVTQAYRGRGIGTALIGFAGAYAARIGIPDVYLHAEKSNADAIRLYMRLGFSIKKEEDTRCLMHRKFA